MTSSHKQANFKAKNGSGKARFLIFFGFKAIDKVTILPALIQKFPFRWLTDTQDQIQDLP